MNVGTRPEDEKFMAVAMVPKPRVNLPRFRRAFAPSSKGHAQVTPAERAGQVGMPRLRPRRSLRQPNAGAVRIACIEGPDIIEKVLTHLGAKGLSSKPPGRRRYYQSDIKQQP
jgi:hypothetical protein